MWEGGENLTMPPNPFAPTDPARTIQVRLQEKQTFRRLSKIKNNLQTKEFSAVELGVDRKCRIKYNHTNTEIQCVRLSKPSLTRKLVATGTTLGSFVVLLLVVAVYRVNRSNRKEKESQLKIETFLEDYKAQKTSRYSYADIKRITNQFQDKLGQGAYGIVFKGKLSSECFVAVKVLNSSNGNGEDFIKEVGMMGSFVAGISVGG